MTASLKGVGAALQRCGLHACMHIGMHALGLCGMHAYLDACMNALGLCGAHACMHVWYACMHACMHACIGAVRHACICCAGALGVGAS